MAQVPSDAQSRFAGLYAWRADREQRALAAGGKLPWTPEQPSYDATPERLAALQRGEPVDVQVSALPSWARVGEEPRWWRRVTVSADGSVEFWDDDGSAWLAENNI
jgi:hypothetical protein